MGEHVRSLWLAMSEVGIDAKIVDIYGPQGPVDSEFSDRFGSATTERLGRGVNIFCVNGDEVEQALGHLKYRDAFAEDSYNIIYPAWELERYPLEWGRELARFDEIWAPSKFIERAIATTSASGKAVFAMPLACEVRRRGLHSRRRFGVRESAYAFLFAFDFLSYLERKNPLAVIRAFSALVKDRPFDDIVLVIKTNNADAKPDLRDQVKAALAPLGQHAVMIDGTLSELEMNSLMWLSDCFVSLHRSEGFGRGLSEAMAMGKPVIATAYSGNMEFCDETTAHLVPYELVPLREGEYPHWEGQRWAEADIEAAARAMRQLVDNPSGGREMGRRARTRLANNFGYLAAGLRYAKRLAEVSASRTAA